MAGAWTKAAIANCGSRPRMSRTGLKRWALRSPSTGLRPTCGPSAPESPSDQPPRLSVFLFQRAIHLGAKPGQGLDHQAVLLGLEIHRVGAFAAHHFIAAMEAGERLQALAAALVASHDELDSLGGGRSDDI